VFALVASACTGGTSVVESDGVAEGSAAVADEGEAMDEEAMEDDGEAMDDEEAMDEEAMDEEETALEEAEAAAEAARAEAEAEAEAALEEAEAEAEAMEDLDDADLNEAAARAVGSSGFADDLTDEEAACTLGAIADNPDLISLVAQNVDIDDLPVTDQVEFAIVVFDCAPDTVAAEFAEGFESGADGIDSTPEVTSCLINSMSSESSERRNVLAGFLYLGEEEPVPTEFQPAIVDTMTTCLSGDFFADAMAAEALDDPALAAAVDFDCLKGSLNGEAMRPMWQAMVEDPSSDFDSLAPDAVAPMLNGIFGCMSFAKVLEAEAGVEFSEESATCIDDSLADLDLAQMMTTGEGGEEITTAMFTCLTPEELLSLGG